MRTPPSRPGCSRSRVRGASALAAGLVLLLADIVLAAGPGAHRAASGPAVQDRTVAGSLVSRLRGNGAELTRLGPAHGLEGWNVRLADGSSYILYLTPDGAGLVGHLYGPDGHSVTVPHLQALARDPAADGKVPVPDRAVPAPATSAGAVPSRKGAAMSRGSPGGVPGAAVPARPQPSAAAPVPPAVVSGSPGPLSTARRSAGVEETAPSRPVTRSVAGHRVAGEAALLRRTREAPGIELLEGSPVLHVIADPGCGPSRAWIDTLLRYGAAGFGLRILPVGLMGAASARAALWILEQPDRAAAWHATAGRPIGDGDLAGTSADLLAGNNALFAAWRGRVLPLSLRAVPEGVERIDGVPGDAAALVRRLVLEDPR